MKICILSEFFYPDSIGSTGKLLSELASDLNERYDDLQIDVITSRYVYREDYGKLQKHESWNGINIERVSCPFSRDKSVFLRVTIGLLFSWKVLVKLLLHKRYDAFLVVTNPPALVGASYFVGKIKKIPYVYLIHDLFPDVAIKTDAISVNGFAAQCAMKYQKKWLHHSSKVVVLGRCMKNYMMRNYDLPEKTVSVIPNWADPESIKPISSKESHFRKRHHLNGTVVMYAGNLGQHQSFDILLDAAEHLKRSSSNVTIAIVGDGAKKNYIESEIEKRKLTNIRLFPFVPKDEFSDMLGAADISLITLEEGMDGLGVPSKLYSTLASARPIVAILPSSSEVAKVIAEDKCGIRVDYGDTEGLVEAITKLSKSEQMCDIMGKNARNSLIMNYTLENASKKFFRSFCEVAKQNAFSYEPFVVSNR